MINRLPAAITALDTQDGRQAPTGTPYYGRTSSNPENDHRAGLAGGSLLEHAEECLARRLLNPMPVGARRLHPLPPNEDIAMTDPTETQTPGADELRHQRRDRLAAEFPLTQHFGDPTYERRRLAAECAGTFLLVLAGGGAVVIDKATGGEIGRAASVTAPGLTVMAVILFMGEISGAHLNPAVSLAFALRGDFPWRRVGGYLAVQIAGAMLACLLLRLTFGMTGKAGLAEVGPEFSWRQALAIETLLTAGLVSTILGTASTAQNVGHLSALGVGGYIVLAGLWSSPVSGAIMNPARALGPALATWDFANLWLFVAGPLAGALIAVGLAWVLRGPGGDPKGKESAQGKMNQDAGATSRD